MTLEAAGWLTDNRERVILSWWNAMTRRGLPPARERAEAIINQLCKLLTGEETAGLSPASFLGDSLAASTGLEEGLAHLTCLRYAIIEVIKRADYSPPLSILESIEPAIDGWLVALATWYQEQLRESLVALNRDLNRQLAERTSAMKTALSRLEKLERTKTDFISIAAHELKTPLTLVSGYGSILAEEAEKDPAGPLAEFTAGILRGAKRLEELIDDLIEVASIDSDMLELQRSIVFLDKLVAMAVADVQAMAPERQHQICIHDLDKLPRLEGDPQRLYQVFVRLIGNAVKYTPDGGRIDISGRLLYSGDRDGGDQFVELVVADTGIGIDPEEQEWIFEKFYRIGNLALHSTSKAGFKGGGPGLGLTIARGIVTAHGGVMWVESEGHDETHCPGSAFHIILPIRPGRSAAQTEQLLRRQLLKANDDISAN